MPDDPNVQIINDAALKVILADEQFVPGLYRHLIPSDAPGKLASEIAVAAAAAIAAKGANA